MASLRRIWSSWSTRRRAVTVGVAVLAIAGVAVAGYFVFIKRPADVSNPDVAFEAKEVKIPKRSELKNVNWPIYGLNPERTRLHARQVPRPAVRRRRNGRSRSGT